MTWTLYKQDPAIQTLRPSLILAFFATLMIRQVLGGLVSGPVEPTGGFDNGWLIFTGAMVWATLLLFVISGNVSTHCGRLGLTLPLSARHLWLTRLAAMLSAALLPLALITLGVSVRIDPMTHRWALHLPFVASGLHAGAALALAITIMQSPAPALQRVGKGVPHIIYLAVVSVGMLLVTLATASWPPTGFFFIAVAGALAGRVYWSLPSVFSVAPRETEEDWSEELDHLQSPQEPPARTGGAESGQVFEAAFRSQPFPRLMHLTIWRLLHNNIQNWGGVILLLVIGERFFVSVFVAKDTLTYAVPLVAWIYLIFFNALKRAHPVASWPISRKLLFAHCCAPPLLVLLLGLGIGATELATGSLEHNHVAYRDHKLVIPPEFGEISWDGQVDPVIAPWGEEYAPRRLPVLPGMKARVFNPYEHGPQSSPEFIAFQIERAAAAIHEQRRYDPDEFDASILDDSYEAAIARGAFTVARSTGRASPIRVRTTAMGFLVMGLIGLPILFTAFEQLRLGPHRKIFQGITLAAIVLFAGTYIVGALGEISGLTSHWAINAFLAVLFRGLALDLPISTALMWVLVGVIYIGWYLFGQWRFGHADLLPRRCDPFTKEH